MIIIAQNFRDFILDPF